MNRTPEHDIRPAGDPDQGVRARNREAGEHFTHGFPVSLTRCRVPGGEINNVIATLLKRQCPDEIVIVGRTTTARHRTRPGRPRPITRVGSLSSWIARVMSRHSSPDGAVRVLERRRGRLIRQHRLCNACRGYGNTGGALPQLRLCLLRPENRSVLISCMTIRGCCSAFADHNTLWHNHPDPNRHTCESDHTSFQALGFPALTTHSEEHGPAHTPEDTIDHVSSGYMAANARLGLSVLAKMAGLRDDGGSAAIPKAPVAG